MTKPWHEEAAEWLARIDATLPWEHEANMGGWRISDRRGRHVATISINSPSGMSLYATPQWLRAALAEREELIECKRHYTVLCQMDRDVEEEVRAGLGPQIEALRTERDALRGQFDAYRTHLESAERHEAALRAALQRYGRHMDTPPTPACQLQPCTCGLDAALNSPEVPR